MTLIVLNQNPKTREMSTSTEQSDCDALALFIEAVEELRSSPYFQEEYRSLSLSVGQDEPLKSATAKLPDENIVRSTLIPFRRVWQKEEPSNYHRVANIIKKLVPDECDYVDDFMFKGHDARAARLMEIPESTLSPADTIDIWLNNVYFHGGKKARAGKFTRTDFEREEAAIGPARFKFHFFMTISAASISFANLLPIARHALRLLAQRGVNPSFVPRTKTTGVLQFTPGFTPDQNAIAHKIWRLRRRRAYGALNQFMDYAKLKDSKVARLTRAHETFPSFVSAIGLLLRKLGNEYPDMKQYNLTGIGGFMDDHAVVYRNKACRTGWVAVAKDKTIYYGGEFEVIVAEQYSSFRVAFLADPFK